MSGLPGVQTTDLDSVVDPVGEEPVSLVPRPMSPVEVQHARAEGGATLGLKKKHKKHVGQQSDAAVRQLLDHGPELRPGDSAPSCIGPQMPPSAGKFKEDMMGSKLGSGSGGGGSLKPAQIGSVERGVKAVAAEGALRKWADECDVAEGVTKGHGRASSHASVPKVKQKGKGPQSS